MKKIVIIGANDFQNQLILKAKEMGFETHVFAWQDGSIGERTADHFYPVSIVEIDEILEKCQIPRPKGHTVFQTGCSGNHRIGSCEYYRQQGGSRLRTSGKYTGMH